MKKFILNLKDEAGFVRTGYEETLTGTMEEVTTDYLHYHKANTDDTITEGDIDCEEVEVSEVKKLSEAIVGDTTDHICEACGEGLELHEIDASEGIAWLSCQAFIKGDDGHTSYNVPIKETGHKCLLCSRSGC